MERLTLAYYYVREMVKEWLLKAGKEAEALLDKLDLEEEQAAEMPPPLCVPVKKCYFLCLLLLLFYSHALLPHAPNYFYFLGKKQK